MSAALKHPSDTMSLAEFLDFDAPPGVRLQLVDGVPMAMAPTSTHYGSLQAELARLLGNHLLQSGSPCQVITAPGVVPRVRAGLNFRIPDVGVRCTPPVAEPVLAEPVFLCEILSPSNQAETWANVWAYTTIPSVLEILVIRSDRIEGELLRRGADGYWPANPMPLGAETTLSLDSLGFAAPMAALYRTTGL